jgi:ABC-type Fe3+/spermidine/putrescine transport system ATPase subunit
MVAQDYALFPHLNLRQNLEFGLKMRKVPPTEAARRIEEALAMVNLQGFGDRMPRQLSGGQQQRVALARALVTRPSVLLLDEPFGALDKKLREQLQIEVKHVQQLVGITTISVTHDQSEALSMADRIVVMQQGRLAQLGRPEAIYERPATRFVADFIGMTNFLSTKVLEIKPNRIILGGPGNSTISAPYVNWARSGMRVELAVRPERICIAQQTEGQNVLRGRIAGLTYLGDRTRVTLELEDGCACYFMTQPLSSNNLKAQLVKDRSLEIAWPIDAGILLQPQHDRQNAQIE